MAKYLFVSTRVTDFEDYIEADTQDEAIKIYEQLIVDEMNIVNQWFEYGTFGLEVE